MSKAIEALDQIASRVGILACVLVFWMYMHIQDLEDRVNELNKTTKDLSELKTDVASINAKLSIILADYSKLK